MRQKKAADGHGAAGPGLFCWGAEKFKEESRQPASIANIAPCRGQSKKLQGVISFLIQGGIERSEIASIPAEEHQRSLLVGSSEPELFQ